MQENDTFSVVVSTFDRNDDLTRCLEALSLQTYPDFKIIIINGGDYDKVKQAAGNFSNLDIEIITQTKRGLSEARNLGWINAKTDIVCFIDDDLVVSSAWLENIRKTFISDNKVGGVSGPTIIPQDRQLNRDFASFLNKFRKPGNIFLKIAGKIYLNVVLEKKFTDVGKILKSGAFTPGSNYLSCLELPGLVKVDYLEACHMCFRRALLEKTGGFDYVYTGTGEWAEPDLCFKIKKLGYELVFNPQAVTEHHISQGGVFKARTQAYERSRNFIHFYFKWIKPDTFEKFMRFSVNLLCINLYWVYKFIQTANIDWLNGVGGTFSGLASQIKFNKNGL